MAKSEEVPVEAAPEADLLAEVEFDFTRITARQVAEMLKDFKSGDIQGQAAIIARFCKTCPAAWGDPAQADTFYDLPWWGGAGFRALRDKFMTDFNDPGKN